MKQHFIDLINAKDISILYLIRKKYNFKVYKNVLLKIIKKQYNSRYFYKFKICYCFKIIFKVFFLAFNKYLISCVF